MLSVTDVTLNTSAMFLAVIVSVILYSVFTPTTPTVNGPKPYPSVIICW